MSICVSCLREIPYEEFNDNDGVCDPCADLRPADLFVYRSNTPKQDEAVEEMEKSA